MKQKIENDLAAFMRSVAARRARNVDVAESAVRQSKSFTEQEALSQKLIDYVASSEDELFRQIEAKPIKRFDGKTVTLHLSGSVVRTFEMTLKQKILDRLMDPNVAFSPARGGTAFALRGVQPPGRGRARHGRRGLHSARGLCAEPAPGPLRGAGCDCRGLRPVRA